MDELFDKELMDVMGDHVQIENEPKVKGTPGEVRVHNIFQKRNTTIERLAKCCKWTGVCGGISMLLWWFQVNGLMALEAAYPCILASAVIGGFGVGRSLK